MWLLRKEEKEGSVCGLEVPGVQPEREGFNRPVQDWIESNLDKCPALLVPEASVTGEVQ